jgi:endonuclease-3
VPGTRSRRLKVTASFVLERLSAEYGPVKWAPRLEPVDELIFTVLTQHTSDLNAGRAYRAMRARYPAWEDVIAADPVELATAIRSGGLANQKSVRIQQILTMVRQRRPDFDLRFLASLPLAEAKAWLTSLPGVGPKTAAVTLAFSLGMSAMPVDTHIFRVARRTRLIGPRTSVEDAHDRLESMVAPHDVYAFHVLLIQHGRRTCQARRPRCGSCALAERCPSSTVQAGAG